VKAVERAVLCFGELDIETQATRDGDNATKYEIDRTTNPITPLLIPIDNAS
jgi:hypothetical protein